VLASSTNRDRPTHEENPAAMATDEQLKTAADRRVRTLDLIREHITTKGYPPTLTELAGTTSVDRATVVVDVRVLEKEGLIEVDRGITRGIRLAGHDVVLVPRGA
jgi:SOS-response transcriptional repressor LexA